MSNRSLNPGADQPSVVSGSQNPGLVCAICVPPPGSFGRPWGELSGSPFGQA